MNRLLVALLLLLPMSAHAEPLPDTPAGRVFTAWLDSYNSADPQRVQAFQQTYKRETPVEEVLAWRSETGGYVVDRVELDQPESIVVLLHEQDSPDASLRFGFDVGAGDPATIKKVHADFLPVARLPEARAVDALIARIDQLARDELFSGAALIARDDEVLLQRSWGYSDRSATKPVSTDTQFRLGSMNKLFTAVAALQLIEAGTLALDDTVGEHLPAYPNKDVAAKVTVRHLLTHSGGTGDIFGEAFDAHRTALKTHDDYLALYGGRGLAFAPGSKTEYSNYGFVLLGALIEKVSGQSYYDYVREHIFEPAGMTATGALPESDPVPNRAVGYMRRNGEWVRNDDTLPYRGTAAGGGYSTADDLLRFARALQAGKLLSKSMLAESTRLQGEWQGYGFETLDQDSTLRNYGHGGMAPGMNAHFRVFSDLGYVVVVLSNFDPPAAGLVYNYFQPRMPQTR